MNPERQNVDRTLRLPSLYSRTAEDFYVIAHRGAGYDYPENTMIAFEKALEMGADMIELDVMLTREGVPVVFHDERVDQKTDGSGRVDSYTLDELLELDAGSWFEPEYAGARIPTLEEVLTWASGRISLNLEIKEEAVDLNRSGGGVEERCVELVKKYGMEEHVLVSSFSYPAISRVRKIAPSMSIGLLYNTGLDKDRSPAELTVDYGVDTFNCHWRQFNRSVRMELHRHDVPVFIYTVNSEKQMRTLIHRGVTGIITDRPDLLRLVALEMLCD